MATDGGEAQDLSQSDELDRLKAENQALQQRLGRRLAWRKWLSLLLVILTTISIVATTLAVWAHRTIFDTDNFMETIEPALDDPAFYTALSTYISDQILAAVDIETRVTESLTNLDEYLSTALLDALEVGDRGRALLSRFDRPSLAALAPSITEFLETRIKGRTESFINSQEFRDRFPDLVRRVHEVTISLVRNELNELPNVYMESGEVRVNLVPVIADVLRRAAADLRELLPDFDLPDVISDRADEARQQLAEAIQARLPEDFGQVTIMTEDALGEIQEGANRLDRLVWLLVGVSVVLALLTIAISPTRRRTALQLGLGLVVAFLVGGVILRRLNTAILGEITSLEGEQAARALFTQVMASLRAFALIVGIVAGVVAIGAYLAGRPAWLRRMSERYTDLTAPDEAGSKLDRWMAGHYDLLRIVGVGLAVVAVFLTGFDLLPVILIGAVLALYLWAVSAARRRSQEMASIVEEPTPTEARSP